MAESRDHVLKTLQDLQSLRQFLKTEMSIDGATMQIRVYNEAPPDADGSEIVFMGVGLAVIDAREHNIDKSNVKFKATRSSDNTKARQKYDQGHWYSGTSDQRFPVFTSDEIQHGQILFPGEGVLYEITASEDTLRYLDIRVEGSISRRHLLHISRPMEELRKLNQPYVVQTFQALDSIDLYSPLTSLVYAIPAFGPETTLADIDRFKEKVEKTFAHLQTTSPELKKVINAAPNQELRDLLKQQIGGYLKTSGMMCQAMLKALSGGDIGQTKECAEKLRNHLLTLDEVKKAKAESMARFGIKPV